MMRVSTGTSGNAWLNANYLNGLVKGIAMRPLEWLDIWWNHNGIIKPHIRLCGGVWKYQPARLLMFVHMTSSRRAKMKRLDIEAKWFAKRLNDRIWGDAYHGTGLVVLSNLYAAHLADYRRRFPEPICKVILE